MDGDGLASRVRDAQQRYEISGILTQQQPYGLPPGELLGMPTPYVPLTPLLPELPEKEPVPPLFFPGPTPKRGMPAMPVRVSGREPQCRVYVSRA